MYAQQEVGIGTGDPLVRSPEKATG